MKINITITFTIILAIILNIYNYNYFLYYLSITWYITSILIIYSAIKNSLKYKFIQLNIKKIITALKSKSSNSISSLASLCVSLAAKIGVGSLSGIALAIYYGGVGTIFWLIIISLIISINTYVECLLGTKYRDNFLGGPSYYIKKCLSNNYLSKLYGLLIIITYSGFFLSIQSNTIYKTMDYFNVNNIYTITILVVITFLIITKGIKNITKFNRILVPIMLISYMLIGIYITSKNLKTIPVILIDVIKAAINIKSIIPVFLIGIQRGIFITESSIGTSAITSSMCDNKKDNQALLEVFGIYITIFIVSLTTFIIITTSNYHQINILNPNGIEIVIYAFKYHFGNYGEIILSVITIIFAFSTIISSYYFGESNLNIFTKNRISKSIYKILFIIIILISFYIKPNTLWNLTDFLVAILAIINTYSIIKIQNTYKNLQ